MDTSHYDWTDYYDIVSTGLEHDVDFYTAMAREANGPILELGCGTGRITIPAVMAGVDIVGLDLSEAMLEKARMKAKMMKVGNHVAFVQADMRDFTLPQKFAAVIIPYRTFLHLLTVKDQLAALRSIRSHLQEDGILAFNIFVPSIKHLYEQDEKSSTRGIYEIPGTEDRLYVWDYTRYDHHQQIAQIIRQYERVGSTGVVVEKVNVPFYIRYMFPVECHHLLKLAGFTVVNRYGDFQRSEFGPDSTELIVVAKKIQ
ncbi:class I SAM-dependent methyltransferase [Aneurinibacillus sp. Ricciae_BoGa-3]|uniref:class I SAM-dependent methyltransferase n=1 Tax=Aneurinibacillus sp. Ricciae_BoGa-3 TaxID=3022697 RepID=UPI0023401C70|nr:class I SAM-dependent methyltransferase [Aneurinibacillus sp. Ricciae_BoGa-3]WCK55356.1 class I SAM-dependent methyltransferase [Aneurinibacillus sp. Ricciae_BoGa-3]